MSDELLKNEGEDNETEAHQVRSQVRSLGDEGDVEAHTAVRAANDESDDVEAHQVRAQVRAANDDEPDVEAHQVRAQVRAANDDEPDDFEAHQVRA